MVKNVDEQDTSGAAYTIALALITIASMTFAYFGLQQRVASGWPSTTAKIESAIQEDEPQPTESREFRHHIKVVYDYTVDGKKYRTSEIAVPLIQPPEADGYLKKFAPGSNHEVKYNPNAPQQSQLASVSKNARYFFMISIGLAILVVCGAFFRKRILQQR